MNARGSTEVIVATIGLSMGALSQDLYTMIVAMAVVTTMAMPPTLRWALGRLPLREEERARLEREAFEAAGLRDQPGAPPCRRGRERRRAGSLCALRDCSPGREACRSRSSASAAPSGHPRFPCRTAPTWP